MWYSLVKLHVQRFFLGPENWEMMLRMVQQYDVRSSKDQPLLRAARAVLDNFDYMPKERL